MRERLQAYAVQALPDRTDVRVGPLTAIGEGWESEIHAFDLEHGQAGQRQRERLILRLYPAGRTQSSANEFYGMQRLHQAGYPVPQVKVLAQEDSPFGRPFVLMERIDGPVMWSLFHEVSLQRRQELLALFCELFVRLHRLDWQPFVRGEDVQAMADPYFFVDRWLETGDALLAEFPALNFAALAPWLRGRRDTMACPGPSVVHGDFHPANVLLRDDGTAVVIDWTSIQVSDARFDLAWSLLLARAYGGAELHDAILQGYEAVAGASVERIETFEVFACARRLLDVTVSLSLGAEAMGMRPGAVELMRQQVGAYRSVYDLLLERTGIRLETVERLLAELS
jgi:aminoglycoside phosphotransferase (APT) family kinase protein